MVQKLDLGGNFGNRENRAELMDICIKRTQRCRAIRVIAPIVIKSSDVAM